MVMQVTADFLVGGSNPGAANTAPPPASTDQDSKRRPKTLRPGALSLDRGEYDITVSPIAWSLPSENF